MVALMLYKGAKLRLTGNNRENRFRVFHRGIIALVFCAFLLNGCGYKTDPVPLTCEIPPVSKDLKIEGNHS